MKRKVQAQRKFAQGAHIPPNNTNNVSVGNRADLSSQDLSEPRNNIFQNTTSVRSLLDIVCFQNLHPHLQPVVVLRRMQAKSTDINDIPTTSKQNLELKEPGAIVSTPKPIARKKCTMLLRSQSRNLNEPNNKCRKRSPKKCLQKACLTDSDFGIEDNQPLTFFAKKARPKISRGRVTKDKYVARPVLQSINKIVKKRQKEAPAAKVLEVVSSVAPEPGKITDEAPQEKSPTREKVVSVVTPEYGDNTEERPGEKSPSREVQPIGMEVDETALGTLQTNNTALIDSVDNNNTSDINEVIEVKSDIVSSDASHRVRTPTHNILPPFYSFNEINKWICDSLQQENTFKVPEPPNKTITGKQTAEILSNACEYSETVKASRRGSLCPSENYTTVREVVDAPKTVLDQRCKTCNHCCSVDKILQISKLQKQLNLNMLSHINETNSDIYVFDVDNEANNVRSQTYTSKRKERTIGTNKDQSMSTENIASKMVDEKLYVDWCKESPTAIEITYSWVEEKKSHVTCVNIVPKTPELELTELELRENEHTFESILDYIKKLPSRALATKNNQQNRVEAIPRISGETLGSIDGNDSEAGSSNIRSVGSSTKRYKVKQVDAPVFYPTESQFKDPIAYFNEIMPMAAKFGICKVVAPAHFKPKCTLNDEIRFGVTNQYIARLYARWGPASREMSAIKAYLASQSVVFTRPPLLEGVEVNLPQLYHLVQRCGGLKKVIEKKRWSRVADEMRLTKTPNTEKKLDQIYVKYILPYDTLSNKERQEMLNAVEVHWNKKNKRMLDRAMNPLHRQKRLLGESESSEDENDDDNNLSDALAEAEDCVVPGRYMNLATFKKVATKAMETFFSSSNQPSPSEVESAYWKLVLLGTNHVCVNTASIDTGEEGYGFTRNQRDYYGKHPWNLKMLSQNSGNILRSLGSILGVTVPTLHLGMVYSTSCWHRDPHGLPWIEYMHTGPGKIWYGIPDEQSSNFRKAVELLSPTSCQNKSIWLPSDITMIPPKLLLEHNVSISRVVQKPGEFIVVIPKAYSSSISTGYTESESVYFATISWLKSIHQVFHEVRESCEPTMFSLEQLLLSVARDPRASLSVLQQVYASLSTIIDEELRNREAIVAHKVQSTQCKQSRKRPAGAWNIREQDECHICRATLYLSRVRGLTDKKSSVCLQHALRLLDATPKRVPVSSVEMEIFFTATELENIMLGVQNRLLG